VINTVDLFTYRPYADDSPGLMLNVITACYLRDVRLLHAQDMTVV